MSTFAKRVRWFITLSVAALMIAAVFSASASAAAINWTGGQRGRHHLGQCPQLEQRSQFAHRTADDVTFTNVPQPPIIAPSNDVNANITVNSLWYSQNE